MLARVIDTRFRAKEHSFTSYLHVENKKRNVDFFVGKVSEKLDISFIAKCLSISFDKEVFGENKQ